MKWFWVRRDDVSLSACSFLNRKESTCWVLSGGLFKWLCLSLQNSLLDKKRCSSAAALLPPAPFSAHWLINHLLFCFLSLIHFQQLQQQSHLPRQHLQQQRSPYPVQQVNQFQGKSQILFPILSQRMPLQWARESSCVLWRPGFKQCARIGSRAHTAYFTKGEHPALNI